MDSWWSEMDEQIVDCLAEGRAMTVAEIGERLGLSEEAATSLLCLLVQEGRLRIRQVTADPVRVTLPAAA